MASEWALCTEGRPQEIIEKAVRKGETIDHIFLKWLWSDFCLLRDAAEQRGYERGRQEAEPSPVMLQAWQADKDRIKELEADRERLLEVLSEMVSQHCLDDKDDALFSGCLSANAHAMDALIEAGYMEEVGAGFGRSVTARFVKPPHWGIDTLRQAIDQARRDTHNAE